MLKVNKIKIIKDKEVHLHVDQLEVMMTINILDKKVIIVLIY